MAHLDEAVAEVGDLVAHVAHLLKRLRRRLLRRGDAQQRRRPFFERLHMPCKRSAYALQGSSSTDAQLFLLPTVEQNAWALHLAAVLCAVQDK